MKKRTKHTRKRALILGGCLALVAYVIWVMISFDDSIQIYDSVGLSDSQTNALVEHARSIGSFPESTIEMLPRKSRLTPWLRAELFISITGTEEQVEVTAGFNGGPLYGGGTRFVARWLDGDWVFSSSPFEHWVS